MKNNNGTITIPKYCILPKIIFPIREVFKISNAHPNIHTVQEINKRDVSL
jgi:hypothetical protein